MQLVSIIIPTYNRAWSLNRAIDSVFAQTFTNWELIIIDDGSTDETPTIVAPYLQLPQVKYYKIKNQGVSCARNYGQQMAKAPWLAFLDSDDEWLPHKLQVQIDFVKKNPTLNFIYGNERWIRNGVRVNLKTKHRKMGGDVFLASLNLCLIGASTVLIKTSTFLLYQKFNEDFLVCEDYDLWLRITSAEEIGYIAEAVINKYGGHADQLSHKYFAMDYFRIKSMHHLLTSCKLLAHQKYGVHEEIVKKAEILIKGYKKHQNLEKVPEIEEILDSSKAFFQAL